MHAFMFHSPGGSNLLAICRTLLDPLLLACISLSLSLSLSAPAACLYRSESETTDPSVEWYIEQLQEASYRDRNGWSSSSAAAGTMRASRFQVPPDGGGACGVLPRQEGGLPEDRPRHHPGGRSLQDRAMGSPRYIYMDAHALIIMHAC